MKGFDPLQMLTSVHLFCQIHELLSLKIKSSLFMCLRPVGDVQELNEACGE